MRILLAFALLLNAALIAADKADITLNDGQVLKAARIVAIGEKTVTVAHAGGVVGVPVDNVPLDIVARAHMEISAKQADKKKADADAAERAKKRIAESDAKKAQELQERLAMAMALEKSQAGKPVVTTKGPAVDAEKRLIDLKAKFPPKKKLKTSGARGDLYEYESPHGDVWSYYRGVFQTTTVAALPKTIALMEGRMEQDLKTWEAKLSAASNVRGQTIERAQASGTVAWLGQSLRAFLNEARKLAQTRN